MAVHAPSQPAARPRRRHLGAARTGRPPHPRHPPGARRTHPTPHPGGPQGQQGPLPADPHPRRQRQHPLRTQPHPGRRLARQARRRTARPDRPPTVHPVRRPPQLQPAQGRAPHPGNRAAHPPTRRIRARRGVRGRPGGDRTDPPLRRMHHARRDRHAPRVLLVAVRKRPGGHQRAHRTRTHAHVPRPPAGRTGRAHPRPDRRLRLVGRTHPRLLPDDRVHARRAPMAGGRREDRGGRRLGQPHAHPPRGRRAGRRRVERARARRTRRAQPRADRQGQAEGPRQGHRTGPDRLQAEHQDRAGPEPRQRRVRHGRQTLAHARGDPHARRRPQDRRRAPLPGLSGRRRNELRPAVPRVGGHADRRRGHARVRSQPLLLARAHPGVRGTERPFVHRRRHRPEPRQRPSRRARRSQRGRRATRIRLAVRRIQTLRTLHLAGPRKHRVGQADQPRYTPPGAPTTPASRRAVSSRCATSGKATCYMRATAGHTRFSNCILSA